MLYQRFRESFKADGIPKKESTMKRNCMKEKILQEVLEWYEQKDKKPDISEFVNLVINKTADSIFETIEEGLKEEFDNGTLTHPYFISNEYYLELKLKEIKAQAFQSHMKQEKTINDESSMDHTTDSSENKEPVT
jgi:hypothetical protein